MYSLGDAAPVNNPGYFDVPIHNDLSNPIREGNYIETSNYQFNNDISNTINNAQNYLVNQTPGLENPSPSLYYEQDQTMSGYEYPNDMNNYKNVLNQKKKFNSKQVPQGYKSYELENFQNQGGPSGGSGARPMGGAGGSGARPMGGGAGGRGGGSARPMGGAGGRGGGRPQMPNNISNVQPQARPNGNRNPPNRPMNQPNLVNSQNQVKPTNRPIKDHRGRHRPYPNHHNRHHDKPDKIIYNNYIPYSRPDSTYYHDYIPRFIPNNYLNIGSIPNIASFYNNWNNLPIVDDIVYDDPIETPVIENRIEDSEIIVNNDNNDQSTDVPEKKIKSKRKTKNKKKSNLIYLVLFLLIIVVVMMLYIIFKNQKRVRF